MQCSKSSHTSIKDVASTIEPMARKNGNRLVIECCPVDLGTIHADQTRFRQCLLKSGE